MRSERRADLFRRRRRVSPGQARARLPTPHRRPWRGSPRLRGSDAGRDRRVRRRAGDVRGSADPARPCGRARAARPDVKAAGRFRDAGRARRATSGLDATRFFMLQRSHDTTVDLDLELARRQSNDNPVYYVQYAHARIASILRKAGGDAVRRAETMDHGAVGATVEPAERTLLKRLLELPVEVRESAERRAPHRLCAYAVNVAADFHAFYRDCKVIGAGEGAGTGPARPLAHDQARHRADLGAAGDQRPRADVARRRRCPAIPYCGTARRSLGCPSWCFPRQRMGRHGGGAHV